MIDIEMPRMIQIGSTGRNSGKTSVAKEIISRYKNCHTIYGLKIITISDERGKCQRGESGCGICTSIEKGYELTKECNMESDKDTSILLKAGCEKVYLLKVFSDNLLEGFEAFRKVVPKDALIVCESNSIRNIVKPKLFVMMDNQEKRKKTAQNVIDKADLILKTSDLSDINNIINKINEKCNIK